MHLKETAGQQALRRQLREYFAGLMDEDTRAEVGHVGAGTDAFRRVVRRLGSDGWLGIGWPEEYGGQGRPPGDQFIFFDEAQRAGVPIPFVTLNTVGPTLMQHGTADQKRRFLPGILSGEINFAIGYTEPEAGTDLASLRTRAVRDGDEYVVTGGKVFTSGANQADYVWLACRTDPDAPKHKGISILLVSTSAPGFSWTPIHTLGEQTTTATFYDEVRVPVGDRVGDENDGWRLITTQLNHERVGLAALGGMAFRLFDETLEWARRAPAGDGRRVADLAWARTDLARCFALLEAMRLLNWRMVAATAAGTLRPADASAVKVYGTETVLEVYRLLGNVLGAGRHLRPGPEGAPLGGLVERAARHAVVNTFGGGVNEVQREIVAWTGLGMARQSRTG